MQMMIIIGIKVVYHYNPTSNRNDLALSPNPPKVVYHYNPTSNRNLDPEYSFMNISCISL